MVVDGADGDFLIVAALAAFAVDEDVLSVVPGGSQSRGGILMIVIVIAIGTAGAKERLH